MVERMAQRLLSFSRMKKAKKSPAKRERLPDRSSELLVNQRMLYAVRDELKADIRSHDQRFDSIDAKLEAMEAKLDAKLDSRVSGLEAKLDSRVSALEAKVDASDKKSDSRFDVLLAKFGELDAKMTAQYHRVVGLVEEQNNRNLAVLDGYQSLFDRQDRVEREIDELKKNSR